MRKKKQSQWPVYVVGLSILLIFLLFINIYIISIIPDLAKNHFGEPSLGLNDQDLFLYSIRLFINQRKLDTPTFYSQDDVTFSIKEGQSVMSIAQELQATNLIHSSEAFVYYLIYRGYDIKIQAGEYELSTSQNSYMIAEKLLDPTPDNIKFVILPGWRIEEIGNSLTTSGLAFDESDFKEALINFPNENKPAILNEIENLEGFLFPDQYSFKRDINVDDFIEAILYRFSEKVTIATIDGFKSQGLDIYSAITLASIIQREAMVEDEQALIASVFINRIDGDMKLESDPTVQYALGYSEDTGTWWKNPLTFEDINFASPYNTYLNKGLPPGPICNPSLSVINSVSQPAESEYYFFRADCINSGRHVFSKTLDEHIANECSE